LEADMNQGPGQLIAEVTLALLLVIAGVRCRAADSLRALCPNGLKRLKVAPEGSGHPTLLRPDTLTPALDT